MHYSLTQIEYALAVHKWGHFAKAAEACHVTQPTLSMQIQKLESDLGTVLFDRSKKPILLTEVGQKIIEQFKRIAFEAKKVEEIINSSQTDQLAGKLILGVIPTVAPYVLPRLLPVFEKDFPDIELNILELQTHRIIEALNNDEIDVGLLATPIGEPQMFEMSLFFEPFSVLCRKDHGLSDLKRIKHTSLKFDDIWLLEEGHCLRNQILDVCKLKQDSHTKKKFTFESGSLETLKNLIDSYGGYTLLPSLAAETVGSHSVVIPFERPIPAREIGLLYRREHYKNKLIEALADSVVACVPEAIRKIRQKDLDILPIS